MTFLQSLSGLGRKYTVAFLIIGCLGLTVFAQKVQQTQKNCCYGTAGFEGEVINLNVVNADVRDILNYVTEQYGINFVIDKSVQKTPVTVNISEVPWNIALDAILSSQELGVEVKGRILRIADSKTLANESEIKAKIADAKLDNSSLYTEFIRLSYAMAAGGGSGGANLTTGTNVGGGATSGGAGGDGLLPIIKRRLSRRGAIETDSRTNSLIITDVRENIDAIRQLVAILDQPEPQVEVEARVVIASRDFSRDIGFQLSGIVLGNGIGNGGGIQGNTGISPTGTSATTSGTGGTGGSTGSTNTGSVLNQQGNTNFASQIANTVIGLTTGMFGTAKINALLTMGEKKGQAKTIATPRVTMLNNSKGIVSSGQQIPIVTTQTGANGGGVVFTTSYVSVPLKLEVTPQVTDNGTVILDVAVENSSVSVVSSGGTPAISTQQTKVKVEVPDGGTTVIGGALVDVEGEDVFRTPGLSKIPVIGNLFKRKAVARTTSEVIFFITPRISRPDYASPNGNVKRENRTTTILQPVPLGNPPSNSLPQTADPVQPVQNVPVTQPTNGTIKP